MNNIVQRLKENRDIQVAKSILESNGYSISKESKRLSEAGRRSGWRATKPAASKKTDSTQSLVNSIKSSDEPLQAAFDELVPSSGKADTVAGEMVRAMMRILYRDFNDGDLFYSGYGIETCGSAVAYLVEVLPNLREKFEKIAMREERGREYTNSIEGISSFLINYILDNPELLTQRNDEDMLEYPTDWIKEEWEPSMTYEISMPDELLAHIQEGNIDEQELRYEMESWDYLGNVVDIEIYGDNLSIVGVDPDTYDILEDQLEDWLLSYAHELDDEYGVPGEEDEEEEY